MKDKKFYTIKEAAEILDVHENTIRNMIKSGELKSKKYGSKKQSTVRIYAESLK